MFSVLVYFSGARKPRVVEPYVVIDPVERERRILIYRRSTPLFGTVQPAAVLKDAERFSHILHHFAEGIFKPQWATCAFSISSMLSSPYTDQIEYLPDRSWTMAYSPKAGGLDVAANRALIACMDERDRCLSFARGATTRVEQGLVTWLLAWEWLNALRRGRVCSEFVVCTLKNFPDTYPETTDWRTTFWKRRYGSKVWKIGRRPFRRIERSIG